MSNTCRIGVGGPVGSGKTALIEAITPYFLKLGLQVLIITNDIVTTEDAKHVRKMLKGYLAFFGLILLSIGIMGIDLMNILNEAKKMPHYVIRREN